MLRRLAFLTGAYAPCSQNSPSAKIDHCEARAHVCCRRPSQLHVFAALTLGACMFGAPMAAMAQGADSDAAADAESARIDALLATPNLITPVPQDNAIATAPGLEQQTATPQFTVNGLAPIFFNSNA